MRVLKIMFMAAVIIIGFTVNLLAQQNLKIEKSKYLSENENNFLLDIPKKLAEVSNKIYPSGAIDLKSISNLSEDDLLTFMKLDDEISFRSHDQKESRINKDKVIKRFDQYYKGVKIEGAGYAVKYDRNKIIYFKPQIHTGIIVNTFSALDENQIIAILEASKIVRKELLISNKFHSEYRLVWKVHYNKRGSKVSYVDAHTGEILRTSSGLTHKNAPTEDLGTRNMDDTNNNGTTSLISNGEIVRTFNMNMANLFFLNEASFTNNLIPTSPENNAWTTTNAPSNVFQAHWCVTQTVNEFAQLGVNFGQVNVGANCDNFGFDFLGNIVQIPNAGAFNFSTLDDAFIAFGHSGANTLAHMDVTGHELGHVFLFDFLDSDELGSGSLHEGIADMFGVYIESRVQSLDWIMGDDIPINIRDLQNPLFDCFDEVLNNPSVHNRSTPLGHWFFQLTNGNTTEGIQSIPMLTILNIIMDALPIMPEDADYPEMREATLAIIGQEFGFCSVEYSSFAAAWDFICVDGDVEACPCDADGPNLVITTNTTINGFREINGNIIIESGATLHIHLADIVFRADKGIMVKNGGRLILQGSIVDACNTSQSWAGIKIESGGFFDTDESFLKNVANGVEANANSTLQIYKLNITGKSNNSGIGLKLNGNVNTDFIYYLDIKDLNIGIQSISSSKVHEFNHGSIINTSFGIHSVSSPIIVNDYDINFTNDAITLTASAGSNIFDCDIIYKQQGIAITLSPSTNVQNCSVSNKDWVYGNIENPNERPAIGIVLSDNCSISNNFPISSASNAVSVWGSNGAIIDNNNISTNFNLNGQLVGGPVNLQFGNGHSVTSNTITADQSEFGINSSWAGNTTIMNNTVYNSGFQKNFRTAAIKATGNLGEIIHQNIVTGVQRTGILVQNTSGNDFFCNEINSTYDEAQDILYNSEQQFFKANTFDGGGYDLKIKSEIGTQATLHPNDPSIIIENNGNHFFGGNAEADQAVAANSQFPYNPVNVNHKPANPNPSSGWFTQNTVVPYANCDGLTIGDNFIFGNDPTQICTYWNYLKSIRNTKPELFFVKLVHLLKYAKTKSGFALPNCILFDPVFQSLCGITKIVDVSVALAKVSKSNINTSNLQALQDQYMNERSDAGKSAIKDQMSTEMILIKPQFDNERNADSLRLDSLKNELNTINCSSIIVNKWKEILKIYINFIKKGQVLNNDMTSLESYSTDCSDLYGEAIHLARAMANTYNRTYYDVNDDCLEASTPRITESESIPKIEVTVSPNPTSGLVNVDFSGEYTGIIKVVDLSGRTIHLINLEKANTSIIDLSQSQAGIYFVKLTSVGGKTDEYKILLIN